MKVKKLFLSTSHLCRCVGCKNPYGKREKKEKLTRKMRHPHALQINLSKSNKFGQDKGEELRQGSWSTFKSIVMQERHTCKADGGACLGTMVLHGEVMS